MGLGHRMNTKLTNRLAHLRYSMGGSWMKENGQSMVIVMLALTAIVGMVALAVDGGFAYALHTRMQTAADLAEMFI